MKNYDKGLGQLLELLRKRPDLIREIVFDTARVRRLLRNKAARQLTLGPKPTDFLQYMGGSIDGYPISSCQQLTQVLCAKGTGISLKCGQKTKF
jgi:hypothetical protein